MAMSRFIAFDVETPNHHNSRMSAIGISVVEGRRIVDEFFSYVYRSIYISTSYETSVT